MAGEQAQSSDPRPSTVVVTSENLAEFQAQKLNIQQPKKSGEPKTDEAQAKAEAKAGTGESGSKGDQANGADEALEEEKRAEKDPKKQRLNLRFSELTAARNTAQNERDAAREEARKEREARLALEAKLNAGDGKAKGDKAKEQPPADAKPDRAKFKAGPEGDAEHEEAVLDWKLDQREKKREQDAGQRRAQEAEAAVKRTWAENQKAIRTVIPDYDAKIGAATVVLSDQVTEAIVTMEGEAGPRCLYYFAEFPQEAERIGKLSVAAALRELGKIETKVTQGKPAPKKEETKSEAEVSRAPKPAAPLKTTSAPEDLVDEHGNLKPGISMKEYKEARRAGKIK